jgi:glycosyltransferase involved in cell wall biosynthesis
MEHAAPKNAGPAVAGDKASAKSIPGKPPVIGFVIPCYNEQAALPHLLARLNADLDRLIAAKEVAAESYILIVDDGSRDRTWTLVEEAVQAQPQRVQGLKLSRNVGHQNALLAGLLTQIDKTDATISLDADLQDDVSVLGTMIEHFRNGAEVVFAVRKQRTTDSLFKRCTADAYYRLLNWLGADIVPHHADFRLMSDRAMGALSQFGEVHVFLRGLVVQLGFKTATVELDRLTRLHGKTKYTLP